MRAWTTRSWAVAVGPASAVALVCWAIASQSTGLLCLLPALLLAFTLLSRRYPGEHVLISRHATPAARRWPRARSVRSARTRGLQTVAHGGLLIGRSLAVRPPPLPARASS